MLKKPYKAQIMQYSEVFIHVHGKTCSQAEIEAFDEIMLYLHQNPETYALPREILVKWENAYKTMKA